MLYIRHAHLLTPHEELHDTNILIEGERIAAVGNVEFPTDAAIIDASGLTALPGFIDLQLNGGFGLDFTNDPETIWQVAERLPEHGVTSFLPTIITSPLEKVAEAQAVLRNGAPESFQGAKPLGLHLEGPFLNPAKRGAHNPKYLRAPDLELEVINSWTRDSGVWLVTLAPELSHPTLDPVKCLHANGVVVSAGHSMATYEEAIAAFEAGVTYGTHLFNAMPTLEHRTPGLPAALLTDPRVVVGLIPDGIHMHPAILKLVWQAKGADGINIVTDAMAALGTQPGHYVLADFEVTVDKTSARLLDGRLAGSILSMDAAVRNMVTYTGCSLAEAARMVTTVPARVLGLGDRGQVAVGCIADLVFLDQELNVVKTIVRGGMVYDTKRN
jgi:N-acetylglucosamine-6-phosphate deacetylase